MTVEIHLSKGLARSVANRREVVEVDGTTVGECLDDLAGRIPRIKEVLFYGDSNALYSSIEVRINKKRMGKEGVATKVRQGDEISVKKKVR